MILNSMLYLMTQNLSWLKDLISKIFKYMTSILKNVYINKLADIVNKYNDTVQYSTIKMKPLDVKRSTYFEFALKND